MPRQRSPAAGIAALLLLGALGVPHRASAQRTDLTLTGTVSLPTGAAIDSTEYNAGWVCATGSIGFTAQAATGGARTVTVSIRASGPIAVSPSGTKALADLQWRLATACSATVAGTGWTSLTQTDAAMGSKSIKSTGAPAGRRLTGTVYFRLLLDWASDLGGNTYTMPPLIVTISQ